MAMAGISSELRQIELRTGVTFACMFKQIGGDMGSQRGRSTISSSAPASVGWARSRSATAPSVVLPPAGIGIGRGRDVASNEAMGGRDWLRPEAGEWRCLILRAYRNWDFPKGCLNQRRNRTGGGVARDRRGNRLDKAAVSVGRAVLRKRALQSRQQGGSLLSGGFGAGRRCLAD